MTPGSAPGGRAALLKDFVASLVVFLVALPLCIGIAQACGLPPQTGIVTGIIGGLIVGLIAGSPLQVSGPAAGLVVIVVDVLAKHGGDLRVFGLIVLLAGAMQIAAGALRLGQWFRAVSPAVIQGMLAGIGVLIFADQFHTMVDRESPGKGLKAIAAIPPALLDGVRVWEFDRHHQAAAIGLLTILVIVVWPMAAPRRLRILPGALVGVVVASLAAATPFFDVASIDVSQGILSTLHTPDFSSLTTPSVLLAALTIAVVASAETLLCASAVDQMHHGPRTAYDRELMAQGVGNALCGLAGGLPMTGVIVRSSANVAAGAVGRWSAVMHGLWLLIFVALLSDVLGFIPRAALAGVLVYTGYKLVNVKAIRSLSAYGRGELAIYAATLAGVVGIDLLTGVVLGVVLSFAKLLYTFSHLDIRREAGPGAATTLRLNGAATVVALPRLARELESLPEGAELHVDLEHLGYIDHACLNLIVDWQRRHEAAGGSLVIDWGDLHARFRPERPVVTGPARAAAATPAD